MFHWQFSRIGLLCCNDVFTCPRVYMKNCLYGMLIMPYFLNLVWICSLYFPCIMLFSLLVVHLVLFAPILSVSYRSLKFLCCCYSMTIFALLVLMEHISCSM